MGCKWTTKKNDFPKAILSAQGLNGRKVHIGALNGQNAWLAGIHEYGCIIQVTDKMRAWFASQGYPLKKSTKVIKIPERSFLRNGHDEYAEKVITQTERALGMVASGKMSEEQYIDLFGLQFATAIKTYMRDLSTPANSGMTKERKGSSNPLIDTGGLLGSITYKKV
jgi:hypothetical protein